MPRTTRKKTQATPAAGFETSLGELEKLVERLEGGEQSLEDALRDFERGITLTRQCQQALQEAELRVKQLVQRDGNAGEDEALEDFAGDDDQ